MTDEMRELCRSAVRQILEELDRPDPNFASIADCAHVISEISINGHIDARVDSEIRLLPPDEGQMICPACEAGRHVDCGMPTDRDCFCAKVAHNLEAAKIMTRRAK